jgi:hypothetical protein
MWFEHLINLFPDSLIILIGSSNLIVVFFDRLFELLQVTFHNIII